MFSTGHKGGQGVHDGWGYLGSWVTHTWHRCSRQAQVRGAALKLMGHADKRDGMALISDTNYGRVK